MISFDSSVLSSGMVGFFVCLGGVLFLLFCTGSGNRREEGGEMGI